MEVLKNSDNYFYKYLKLRNLIISLFERKKFHCLVTKAFFNWSNKYLKLNH